MERIPVERLVQIRRAHGTKSVALFGSFAKGDAGPDSDIDVLVEFGQPIGLLALVRLERELSEAMGRGVDLVTSDAISPHLRDEILSSRRIIYQAAG